MRVFLRCHTGETSSTPCLSTRSNDSNDSRQVTRSEELRAPRRLDESFQQDQNGASSDSARSVEAVIDSAIAGGDVVAAIHLSFEFSDLDRQNEIQWCETQLYFGTRSQLLVKASAWRSVVRSTRSSYFADDRYFNMN